MIYFFEVMDANDTTLHYNIDSGQITSTMINDKLKKISRLLTAKKTITKCEKTQIMFFSYHQKTYCLPNFEYSSFYH